MTTAVFDTLKASRDLKAAGIDETHAEAIVTTVAGAFEDTVATKADLKIEIGAVRSELSEVKADIANLKAEVFRALWIQGGGIVALIVGLTKLF